jgi:hypothetical protein
MHRSGTGSHTKSGFSTRGSMALRLRRMEVISLIQRFGLHIKWKLFEKRKAGGRASSSRRSLGVLYLKARFSVLS